ncbi:MAG: phosphoribosylglycinamide formyltransferase [Balneolaceae bacterium]
MKNIVVFASGSGTNFQSLIDATVSGKIKAGICGLIAGKPGIEAIKRAERASIPVRILSSKSPGYQDEMLIQLEKWDPDLIVLAGYLTKLPEIIVEKYSRKIINIHPSLLPKYGGHGFYGMRVHRAVLESGDPESGCTVHYVTDEYDEGPVIAQRKVPVKPGDSPENLAKRVLEEEHKLLPEVVSKILNI